MSLRSCTHIFIMMIGAFLWASYLCGGAAIAQDAREPYASRVDALFADLNRKSSSGLAIAVVRDGKVILRRVKQQLCSIGIRLGK